MRRVVVTGLGIVSSIGNNAEEVLASLKAGRSGITANEEMAEHGFRSRIAGSIDIDPKEHIDKRALRFMGPGAAYAHIAMQQAIADSGLEEADIVNPRTGLVAGSGGPSTSAMLSAHQTVLKSGGTKRIGPFAVPKTMCSTVSANLSTAFSIKGINYSITSACSTSLHCIGNAAEQIMMGKQDVMFAGGGEELDWTLSCLFDAMGAMSSKYNDTPEKASRAFDADRDGFVISGGGGILVLEDLGSEWLSQAGLRPTRQRVALAALLVGDGQHRHVTAESLFAAVQKSGDSVSLATVYNTLRAFCDAGLLQEVTVDGSKSYFDTNTHDHPHFYWEDENRLSDAPADQLEISRLPSAPDGAEIASVDVVIRLRRTPSDT